MASGVGMCRSPLPEIIDPKARAVELARLRSMLTSYLHGKSARYTELAIVWQRHGASFLVRQPLSVIGAVGAIR